MSETSEKFIKVAKLGERVQEFFLSNGSTVSDALDMADCEPEGFEVRLNGRDCKLDTVLRDNDIITLVPDIKGG